MVAEKRKLRDNALKNSRKISGNPQTRPSANTVNYSQLN
jgi:hypothetical protein